MATPTFRGICSNFPSKQWSKPGFLFDWSALAGAFHTTSVLASRQHLKGTSQFRGVRFTGLRFLHLFASTGSCGVCRGGRPAKSGHFPQALLYLNCTIPQQLLLLRLRLLRCERPATACGLSAASGRVSRKTSRAAMPAQNETKPMKAINWANAQLPPAKNMAGWHTLVSSSFSVGPCRHTCLHARSVLPCFGRPTACT